MTQALPKSITLDEFLDWYPDGYGRFELHDGVVVEMYPTGDHEEVAGFIALQLGIEIQRSKLPLFVPRQCVIKPVDSEKTGYIPDVAVLDRDKVRNDHKWQKRSTITQGTSVLLVVEVVSTNWNDDYGHKLADYETLGIPEYWIVDYLALGGRRYIGNPKQPTISIYYLVDGEYQVSQFRGDERIVSPTFPELTLTAEQIFLAGNSSLGES